METVISPGGTEFVKGTETQAFPAIKDSTKVAKGWTMAELKAMDKSALIEAMNDAIYYSIYPYHVTGFGDGWAKLGIFEDEEHVYSRAYDLIALRYIFFLLKKHIED